MSGEIRIGRSVTYGNHAPTTPGCTERRPHPPCPWTSPSCRGSVVTGSSIERCRVHVHCRTRKRDGDETCRRDMLSTVQCPWRIDRVPGGGNIPSARFTTCNPGAAPGIVGTGRRG